MIPKTIKAIKQWETAMEKFIKSLSDLLPTAEETAMIIQWLSARLQHPDIGDLDREYRELRKLDYSHMNAVRILRACVAISPRYQISPGNVFHAWRHPERHSIKLDGRKPSVTRFIEWRLKNGRYV